nr:MAG TPA: hypothetical protein [Caudoviricetes sp.]
MFGKYTGFIKFLMELLTIGVSVVVFTAILVLAMAFVSII